MLYYARAFMAFLLAFGTMAALSRPEEGVACFIGLFYIFILTAIPNPIFTTKPPPAPAP